MSKFKIVNLVDIVFVSVAIFLIFFAWVQFFLKNILLSLFVSVILSISLMLLLKFIISQKHCSTQTALAKQDNIAKFKLAVQTMSNLKLNQLIKKLIPKECSPSAKNGDIAFTKNGISYLITQFYSSELNDIKLLDIIKTKRCANLIIFCNTISTNIQSVITAFKNKKITIITLDDLYEICEQKNIAVDTSNIELNKPKLTIKKILKNSISRKKSKGYFVSGLVLLFSSIIIPYRIYYVVFSTILIALSLVCRLQPISATSNKIFD